MSTSEAQKFAKRARAQRTVESKLDDIAWAVQHLAAAVHDIDRRLKHTEQIAAFIANR